MDFNMNGFLDPKTQALLAASGGLLSAGARSPRPVGFGQALGQGILSGLQGYQSAQQGILAQQVRKAQMDEMQRKAQNDEAERRRRETFLGDLTEPAARALGLIGDFKGAIDRQYPQAEYDLKEIQGPNGPEYSYVPKRPGTGAVTPSGAAPYKAPTLQNLPVPGQPGVTQPTWLQPGQTQGTAVGGQNMPEILNPAVQEARRGVAAAGAPQVKTVVNPAMDPFKNEKALRDEYRGNVTVKNAAEMDSAFKTIETAFKNPSPANDLAMATKYMKILDPTSVVRESELALALNATGLVDKVRNYAESIATGKKLNPQQRQDFYNSAKAINDAFQQQRNGIADNYRGIASQYGLKPENVTFGDQTSIDDLVNKYGKPR